MSSVLTAHIVSKVPLQAFVTRDLQIAILCQHDGQAWEPLFGIKRQGGLFELPSCFALGDPAIAALDQLLQEV